MYSNKALIKKIILMPMNSKSVNGNKIQLSKKYFDVNELFSNCDAVHYTLFMHICDELQALSSKCRLG